MLSLPYLLTSSSKAYADASSQWIQIMLRIQVMRVSGKYNFHLFVVVAFGVYILERKIQRGFKQVVTKPTFNLDLTQLEKSFSSRKVGGERQFMLFKSNMAKWSRKCFIFFSEIYNAYHLLWKNFYLDNILVQDFPSLIILIKLVLHNTY